MKGKEGTDGLSSDGAMDDKILRKMRHALMHADLALGEIARREEISAECDCQELCGSRWCAEIGCIAWKQHVVWRAMRMIGGEPIDGWPAAPAPDPEKDER